MKKIILTLGLIIVFLFTSCGNAENNSGPFVVEYENGIARMYLEINLQMVGYLEHVQLKMKEFQYLK